MKKLLESKQAYGLEYVVDGKVVGFILGTSMLFHYGRTFEINDLAVDPVYQKRGIGAALLERCLTDLKEQGMSAFTVSPQEKGSCLNSMKNTDSKKSAELF